MAIPISSGFTAPPVTPIQRNGPPVAPSTPPPPNPVRSAQTFRSPAQTGARPIDVESEVASVSGVIARSSPGQMQSNASRLTGLNLALSGKLNALRPASQHQVLTLTESVTDLNDEVSNDQYRSASQSGISSKGKVGSPFGVGIPLKPGATVDVVGHGSLDGKTLGGKTPQQLARQLKDGGATRLAVLDLKSCHSEAFKEELEQCLKDVGIEVGEIKAYKGSVAVSRATGEVMQGDNLKNMAGHDGTLPAGETLLNMQAEVDAGYACLDDSDFNGAIACANHINQDFAVLLNHPYTEEDYEKGTEAVGEGQYIRKIAEFNIDPSVIPNEVNINQIPEDDRQHIEDGHCQSLQFSFDRMGEYSGPGQFSDAFLQAHGGLQGIAQTVSENGDWGQVDSAEDSGHYFEAYYNFAEETGAQVTDKQQDTFYGNPLKGVVIRGWVDFESMAFNIKTMFPRGTMKDDSGQVIERAL